MLGNYQRNTAFLYPDLEKISTDERRRTLGLITQITAIVNLANKELLELVDGGTFSFVNCMPKVHMECVSDMPTKFSDSDSVRICIASFDEYDYTNNYNDLINQYKSGQTRISHLVALHITSHSQRIRFSEDKAKKFDAIITTCLDSLEKVLVSIMFDISLYHYYRLSDDLSDRKRFNEIKYEYLLKKFSEREQEELYGCVLPRDTSIYLPISMQEVKIIGRRTRSDTRQDAVSQMLDSYATFLAESSMAIRINKDRNGNMMQCVNTPPEIASLCKDILHEKKNLEKYVIVFFRSSTESYESIVLEYNEFDKVPCWIEKIHEEKAFYKIFLVKTEN